MESIFSERAKANQLSTLKQNAVQVNSPKRLEPIETKKELAKIAGVGEQTVQRTKKIIEKADDKTKDKLRSGDVSINKVYNDIRKKENAPVPNFLTLYIDRELASRIPHLIPIVNSTDKLDAPEGVKQHAKARQIMRHNPIMLAYNNPLNHAITCIITRHNQ